MESDHIQGVAWPKTMFRLARFANLKMYKRNRLVSALLQDRNALRLISAPHGFGKSVLAYQYAQRLFSTGVVTWIDAAAPDFLSALDQGHAIPEQQRGDELPDLLIIDDLPYLDEERAATLSNELDKLLYQGVEVLVTTLPSRDCLRDRQPDRILIDAPSLLVTETEQAESAASSAKARSAALDQLHQAGLQLFGTCPACIWGQSPDAQEECLLGFFQERLPMDIRSLAFAMLLLGHGTFEDLARLGLTLRAEEEALLGIDYPFMEINAMQREFKVPEFPLEVLARVVERAELSRYLATGTFPLTEKALGILLANGQAGRACAVLEQFCSDERCASWLVASGWELLDVGEAVLVDALLRRCSERFLTGNKVMLALRAWTCGLMGDDREASYYASKALRTPMPADADEASADVGGMAAYLALLLFDDEAAQMVAKDVYSACEVVQPEDFLAAMMDSCTEVEVARAQSFLSLRRAHDLEPLRANASAERARAIEGLFTQFADRFGGTLAFRLGLHLLYQVDNLESRRLLKNLGCEMVVSSRRDGVKTLSGALVIGDLWKIGYFGIGPKPDDVRDARMLDMAAGVLGKFSRLRSHEPIPIPWESRVQAQMPVGEVDSKGLLRDTIRMKDVYVPPVNVRLLGGFDVTIGDRLLTEAAWKRKAMLVFAIVMLHQGRDVPRDTFLEQIWPDSDRVHGMDSFYTAWNAAVTMLEKGPYLERTGDFCRFNPKYVNSDVLEFEQLSRRLLTERGDVHVLLDIYARLEALYRGDLVPSERVCPLVLGQRKRYHDMFTDSMVSATGRALEAKDPRVALWFARKAMEQDSKREDVYGAMISAQMAAGQRCSAIRTYFQCKEFLREELGLDPSPDIQDLYEQLISIDPSLRKLQPASFRG